MKSFARHITLFFSAILVLCGTGSCIFKRDYGNPENDGKALFVLHIAPVNTRADGGVGKVTEKIRSLRVIAIGERGIELNEKKRFEEAVPAQELSYFFSWYTDAGKKDFYIIANEESVGEIHYELTDNLPTNLPTALSGLLDQYVATPGEESSLTRAAQSAAEAFKDVINAVYFEPDFKIEENAIFLPYSVFYGDVELKGGSTIKKTMYLVPVATKLEFHFTNDLDDAVEISGLSISAFHTSSWLFARVGAGDRNKKLTGIEETLYWPDWLAAVSLLSWDHAGSSGANDAFNTTYGWIKDYTVPTPEKTEVGDFGNPAAGTSGIWTLPPKSKTDGTENGEASSGTLDLGVYYLPESHHEDSVKEKDAAGKEYTRTYQYGLSMRVHDTSTGSSTSQDIVLDRENIDNLKALFRNTHVKIYVTLSKDPVGIYAEIVPWDVHRATGWVGDWNRH